MVRKWKFDRLEISGSLGDLGTLLPLAIAMIMINGLSPTGLLFTVGLLYILAGFYYGVPIAVQPMKVIGAYAVATAATAGQVTASGLLMGAVLLFLGLTGLMGQVGKRMPRSVIRGVQLSTGLLLLSKGVAFVAGTSSFQVERGAVEPFLAYQSIPVFGFDIPIGIIIGFIGLITVLLLLDNRRFPGGLAVVLGGLGLGLLLGGGEGLGDVSAGFNLPDVLPFGPPTSADLTFALFAMVLPQIPMTIGNAVIANRDLSLEYFGEGSKRVTDRALCVSMGLADVATWAVGGMPLCHGAGGLAAHYRFGARTCASNVIIGGLFLALGVIFGDSVLPVLQLLPLSILGVLLVFAGSQLAMTIGDVRDRRDLFVVMVMGGTALALNLAWGFGLGILLAWILGWRKLSI